MIATFWDAVGPNFVGGLAVIVVVAMFGLIWRKLDKHVVEPLQEVPVIRAAQVEMQDQLNGMDAKVDDHIEADASALAEISIAVEGLFRGQAAAKDREDTIAHVATDAAAHLAQTTVNTAAELHRTQS